MTLRMEHANICVRDIDAMIKFLQTAFPEFRIRHEGIGTGDARWVHIGTDETYLALNQSYKESQRSWVPYSGEPGVNHLAYEVGDAESVRRRLLAGGYQESTVTNIHPHRKRIYFYDPEGNDWEFVEYHSADPVERNDYELRDR